jgi:hypothetical protein
MGEKLIIPQYFGGIFDIWPFLLLLLFWPIQQILSFNIDCRKILFPWKHISFGDISEGIIAI